MSDMILRRAARVVPCCCEVTGTAPGLVVVGWTFAPFYRCTKKSGSSARQSLLRESVSL